MLLLMNEKSYESCRYFRILCKDNFKPFLRAENPIGKLMLFEDLSPKTGYKHPPLFERSSLTFLRLSLHVLF